MKIMEITSGGFINGAVTSCLQTVRTLAERGNELFLVCPHRAWIAEQLHPGEAEVIYSDLHRWPGDELRRIAEIIRAKNIDVVHTHQSRANFFGVLLRRLYGIPCVATAHNRKCQFTWMFNDRVIAPTEANKRHQNRVNFVSKKRIDVIHNFVDYQVHDDTPAAARNEVREEFELSPDDFVIGQCGDVIKRKGLIYLIRALPEILQHVPNAKALVIGNEIAPYAPMVRQTARELGVENVIRWAGVRMDVPRLLKAIDLSILPSMEEGLGMVNLEAMANRLPVIATRVGGMPECVRDGDNGILIAPRRPDQIAAAVVRLARDPELCRIYGEAGRVRVEREFSIESQSALLEQSLRRAAA